MENMTMLVVLLVICLVGMSVFTVAMVRIKTNSLLKTMNDQMININNNTNKMYKQIKKELDI